MILMLDRKVLWNTHEDHPTARQIQEKLWLMGLDPYDYYLQENCRPISGEHRTGDGYVYIIIRLRGGKGGFGSMLRAIGAQIEKTTNREACRDLSGRRLRDINEEKRVKTWLEKQKEREDESQEKKKKKIEKMLAQPKHEFKDEAYEQARTELTQQIGDAVEQGFKQAESGEQIGGKRKLDDQHKKKMIKKKKKGALWLGSDDISSSSDTDTDSDAESSESATSAASVKATAGSSKSGLEVVEPTHKDDQVECPDGDSESSRASTAVDK